MKNNNYMKRMLLSYLPILFVTVSIIIFIFSSIINELNVRNAIHANRLTADYIANIVDNTLKRIALDVRDITESGGGLETYLDSPSDQAQDFEISNLLSGLMIRYSMIDSIYLYRALDGRVLDQSTIRPLEQFPDRHFLSEALQKPYSGVWTSPRQQENELLGSKAASQVISLGVKVPKDSGSLGYLVVNVKLSSFQRFIGQMMDRTMADFNLYDTEGRPFFEEKGSSIASKRLSADIVSDYTGWTYRMSMKGGKLFDFLFHGGLVWIMLALGAIVLAIGLTFYVIRKSYKPIQSIMHRIERFSSQTTKNASKGKLNEFAFIDQAIERLITRNMMFQEQQQGHLVIRRQQFLQMLLRGEFEDDLEAWKQERQHFGWMESRHFMVALLELDNYVQFGMKYNPNDQSLFKFIVSSVASEIADQNELGIVAEWVSKNQMVILLHDTDKESMEHRMLQLSEQIRVWVEEHLAFTVTIGIGTAADDETSISQSFEEAAVAISRKMSLGMNQIIDAAETNGKRDAEAEWFSYLETIRNIVRQLRMMEPGWSNEMKKLIHEMASHYFQRDDVDRLLHNFMFHLEYELESSMPEAVRLWQEEFKPKLINAVEQSDTLSQLEGRLLDILNRLFLEMEGLSQSRRHNALMHEIRDYVAEYYMNLDLSLTLLSDRFQISPKYISQLFKESMGQNFSDFLIGLRLDYAKKLLLESDATVQEISDKLGYSNVTSFIRVFKKVVRLSPGQYRGIHSKLADGGGTKDAQNQGQ